MKTSRMIHEAREMSFYGDGNVIHMAITEAINSKVQVEAILILEKTFSPLKIISRLLLEKYINGEFLVE